LHECICLKVKKTKQKKSTLIDAEPDRISCLPGHVTDQILSFLPIEEAVRTSILSSKWRNKWCTIPNLVFDSHYVSQDPSIVDHVLLLHSGPINKFEISDDNHIPVNSSFSNYIDRWILHLIRRSIKELVLEEHYKIPWCLFSYQGLDCLQLYSCWLKPPTTFEGFRNLTRLELYQVIITQVDLEKLISGCPLLESLMLIDIDNIIQLNIHAPNLKDCDILVAFEDINFDNTFQIVTVSIGLHLDSAEYQSRMQGCPSNLLKFFNHRPHIKSLAIQNYFLKVYYLHLINIEFDCRSDSANACLSPPNPYVFL
jgi:hypothetical protein